MSELYWAETAYLDGDFVPGVLIGVQDGRFASISPARPRPALGDSIIVLEGVVLPGLANAHSHAFHRALRGRTHGTRGEEPGSFWTWRERMYALAAALTPDNYRRLATAVFAEMALAGVSCVGEFHYVHHQPGGDPYPNPNAMGAALVEAAAAAGVRVTLLDTCYLAGGLSADGHLALAPEQARFGDGTARDWAARVRARGPLPDHALAGAAIHSVRAVPAELLPAVVETATELNLPLHVHLSEQPAENEAAVGYYGLTPTGLLAEADALGPGTTAVHATHLTETDIELLGDTGTMICACPCTEADLADGIGPFPELLSAGARVCLGSDQHAHTDLLEEARRLEHHERLRSGRRGTFAPADLADYATLEGHQSLGWHDAGAIEVGRRADLIAISLDTPRTAGSLPSPVIMAASTADIRTVITDGQTVVREGRHRLGDVGQLLNTAIAEVWEGQ